MRVFLASMLGAITGAVLAALFGPAVVSWWGSPPVKTSCDCTANMTWAMTHLVWAQLALTIVGGILFASVYSVLFRRRRRTDPAV
jgi:hypothetical protein